MTRSQFESFYEESARLTVDTAIKSAERREKLRQIRSLGNDNNWIAVAEKRHTKADEAATAFADYKIERERMEDPEYLDSVHDTLTGLLDQIELHHAVFVVACSKALESILEEDYSALLGS